MMQLCSTVYLLQFYSSLLFQTSLCTLILSQLIKWWSVTNLYGFLKYLVKQNLAKSGSSTLQL